MTTVVLNTRDLAALKLDSATAAMLALGRKPVPGRDVVVVVQMYDDDEGEAPLPAFDPSHDPHFLPVPGEAISGPETRSEPLARPELPPAPSRAILTAENQSLTDDLRPIAKEGTR